MTHETCRIGLNHTQIINRDSAFPNEQALGNNGKENCLLAGRNLRANPGSTHLR